MARFTYEVRRGIDSAEIGLGGDLDMAATLQLEPVVEQLLADGVREIVIDLGALSFIDSTGISLLVTVNERSAAAGADLRLLRPTDDVGRVLEVTGVDGILPLA